MDSLEFLMQIGTTSTMTSLEIEPIHLESNQLRQLQQLGAVVADEIVVAGEIVVADEIVLAAVVVGLVLA